MNANIGILGGLAIAQIVLVGIVLLSGGTRDDADTAWLDIDASRVSALTISDGETEVELARDGDSWTVAGLAADADKVTDVLDKLSGLRGTWPVATSGDSARRFEVSDDTFQRRVRVLQGDDVQVELFLGTSPGYQQVHARRAQSDEIFAVALSNYEIPATVDGWLDKTILAVEAPVTSVAVRFADGDTQTLVRESTEPEAVWRINESDTDQAAATTYVNRFASLRVLGTAQETTDSVPQATITLTAGETPRTLHVERLGEEGDYILASDTAGPWYRVATYIAEQLLMQDAELVATDDAPAEDAAQ